MNNRIRMTVFGTAVEGSRFLGRTQIPPKILYSLNLVMRSNESIKDTDAAFLYMKLEFGLLCVNTEFCSDSIPEPSSCSTLLWIHI